MMVGRTIASMIASESIRMVFSAAPIGPCGSRIFIVEPESGTGGNATAARWFHGHTMTSIAFATASRYDCAKPPTFFRLLELRNWRDADARRRQRGHPGSIADAARIDHRIV